jgi:integrase
MSPHLRAPSVPPKSQALIPSVIAAAVRQVELLGQRAALKDTERGLCLRITPNGVCTWSWRGRDSNGRPRRFTLGHYPAIGLAEARKLTRTMAENVRRGGDPVRSVREQRAKARAPAGQTLNDLLDLYQRQVGHGIKSWSAQMEPQVRRVFRNHLNSPLTTLSVGALQLTVDSYPARRSAAFAVACLRPLLRWAVAPGRAYLDRSLLDLRSNTRTAPRDRVLSRDELGRLLPVLNSDPSPYAAGLRIILWSACRLGEVAGATWQNIDFTTGNWTLPITKNGQPHVVPLPTQAIDFLLARRPAGADPDAFLFASPRGRQLTGWEKATARIQVTSNTTGWTRHDLRRTAATMLGDLGVVPDIIEATLNHTSIRSPLAATYNRSRYRPQVRTALQRLADEFDAIEAGAAPNVIRLDQVRHNT